MLVASVLLFIFRRVVQDGEKIHFREETPTMPEEGEWPTGFEAESRSLPWRPDPAIVLRRPNAQLAGAIPKEKT